MGKPLSPLVKHQIVSARLEGAPLEGIARSLGVSYGAVRGVWVRYSIEGAAGLAPRYGNNGRRGPGRDCLFFRAACWLKRLHPDWGAPMIRAVLEGRYGGRGLASARQMNRWFAKARLSRRGSRMPANPREWAAEVHDTWQVDAKERFGIGSGGEACWLTIVDERSGALVEAPPFPPR